MQVGISLSHYEIETLICAHVATLTGVAVDDLEVYIYLYHDCARAVVCRDDGKTDLMIRKVAELGGDNEQRA